MPVVVFRTNFKGVADRIQGAVLATDGILEEASRAAGREILAVTLQSVKDHTPVKSGALRDSTTGELGWRGKTMPIITIRQTEPVLWNGQFAPLAEMLTHGTQAHTIPNPGPRIKQALWWEGAAHPVRVVHHPGTDPNPYIQDSLNAASGPTAVIMAKYGEEAAAAITESMSGDVPL